LEGKDHFFHYKRLYFWKTTPTHLNTHKQTRHTHTLSHTLYASLSHSLSFTHTHITAHTHTQRLRDLLWHTLSHTHKHTHKFTHTTSVSFWHTLPFSLSHKHTFVKIKLKKWDHSRFEFTSPRLAVACIFYTEDKMHWYNYLYENPMFTNKWDAALL